MEGLVAWLDEQLAAVGTARTGGVTRPRVRPWGTVLTAPTTAGPVWLKIPGSQTRYEVPLYRVLARVVPDHVPRVIAADVEHGRLLLADGGVPLDGPDAMAAALPIYGRLQRALAPHVDALLAAGVPDMRPAVMPERFDEALAAVARWLAHDDDRAVLRRVAAMRPAFAGWCDRLAASPVPASLDHNDLHARNVLATGDGALRFHDWGDSVVAHPFTSLLACPAEPAARDAYLRVFADLAPHADLVAELDVACRVARAARALTWTRALGPADQAVEPRFVRAPLEILAGLLVDRGKT